MKLKGFRWWIIGLICLGTIINYLARNSLAALAPELQVKLKFTTAEYSYIVGAFQIGYCVMQSVCGYFLDVLGLRLGFSLFGVAWSVFNMLHAAAGGWLALAFFRGIRLDSAEDQLQKMSWARRIVNYSRRFQPESLPG